MISVVIPVHNEAAHLGALFEDLLHQDYPTDRYEILVVDGESTDQTRGVVENFARSARVRILCLPNPRRLSSAGRNVGVRASRGDFILFIDGHCRLPGPAFLRHTVRLFEDTGADCLCRPAILETDDNTWFQNVVAHVRSTFLGHGSDSTIYVTDFKGFVNPASAGAFYRRSVFDTVGMHDEGFDACEDVEFNHRVHKAGLRSYLSSSLAVVYRPRSTPFGVFSQLFRYGRGTTPRPQRAGAGGRVLAGESTTAVAGSLCDGGYGSRSPGSVRQRSVLFSCSDSSGRGVRAAPAPLLLVGCFLADAAHEDARSLMARLQAG